MPLQNHPDHLTLQSHCLSTTALSDARAAQRTCARTRPPPKTYTHCVLFKHSTLYVYLSTLTATHVASTPTVKQAQVSCACFYTGANPLQNNEPCSALPIFSLRHYCIYLFTSCIYHYGSSNILLFTLFFQQSFTYPVPPTFFDPQFHYPVCPVYPVCIFYQPSPAPTRCVAVLRMPPATRQTLLILCSAVLQ